MICLLLVVLEVEALTKRFTNEFDMKDLGDAKKILGMKIVRDRDNGILYLSQKRYIYKVLKRFPMDNAKVVSTPLCSHFLLSKEHYPQTKQEEDACAVFHTQMSLEVLCMLWCVIDPSKLKP